MVSAISFVLSGALLLLGDFAAATGDQFTVTLSEPHILRYLGSLCLPEDELFAREMPHCVSGKDPMCLADINAARKKAGLADFKQPKDSGLLPGGDSPESSQLWGPLCSRLLNLVRWRVLQEQFAHHPAERNAISVCLFERISSRNRRKTREQLPSSPLGLTRTTSPSLRAQVTARLQ